MSEQEDISALSLAIELLAEAIVQLREVIADIAQRLDRLERRKI